MFYNLACSLFIHCHALLYSYRFIIISIYVFIIDKYYGKIVFENFQQLFFIRNLWICVRSRVCGYLSIRKTATTGHDVNPALGDPRGGSNAFRFCVSSATRESSQGQVVPRFRASLRHSGRALKIDSNQFYT